MNARIFVVYLCFFSFWMNAAEPLNYVGVVCESNEGVELRLRLINTSEKALRIPKGSRYVYSSLEVTRFELVDGGKFDEKKTTYSLAGDFSSTSTRWLNPGEIVYFTVPLDKEQFSEVTRHHFYTIKVENEELKQYLYINFQGIALVRRE